MVPGGRMGYERRAEPVALEYIDQGGLADAHGDHHDAHRLGRIPIEAGGLDFHVTAAHILKHRRPAIAGEFDDPLGAQNAGTEFFEHGGDRRFEIRPAQRGAKLQLAACQARIVDRRAPWGTQKTFAPGRGAGRRAHQGA
jgi:hypothetical protein